MWRIAAFEEAKRRSRQLSQSIREEIVRAAAEGLRRRSEVALALVFGGLLVPGKPVRDVDVAVYTGCRVSVEEWPLYVDELREELERLIRHRTGVWIAVDVVLLDYAPPGLRAAVLRQGRAVVNREPGLRSRLLIRALDELRGLARACGRLG